jgi:hypothetical protein
MRRLGRQAPYPTTTAQLDRHYRGVTPYYQVKTPVFQEDEGRAVTGAGFQPTTFGL